MRDGDWTLVTQVARKGDGMMKGHGPANVLHLAGACVLFVFVLLIPSCSGDAPALCKDLGTMERYFGFGDSYSPYVEQCFGPYSDCFFLCQSLAASESRNQKTVTPEVCERVPSPDGWADAGYQGWEDAGYVARVSGDGGVDPDRILHVIFRVRTFCGT